MESGSVLAGYTLRKPLHVGSHSTVYLAARIHDGSAVLLKAYSDGGQDALSRARMELDVLKAASGPGVPRALDLLDGPDGPVLVLERLDAEPLAALTRSELLPVQSFLTIAVQITEALIRLHSARFLHLQVQPDHLLVARETLATYLIDFRLASRLGATVAPNALDSIPARGLPYIAPEQTGRMGRGVDPRSDLYSLGATLYFALTGSPPFQSPDALELIHAHIARTPPRPDESRPDVPATVSRIVMKLLQKAPESRYQTARGLLRDLIECKEQLERCGTIENDFPLGSADAPYRPLFSRHLYGREPQVVALREAFASARETTTVLLVSGPPGSGKTALVHALRPDLAESNGYLAQGKFDLYSRDVPYSALVEAFNSLVHQILTESAERLDAWRQELRTKLGASAGVLVDLVPDLALVLGAVPPAPPLGPAETRTRLSLAVHRFVQAAARPEHPLVLFIDDLQWADAGSRQLIQDLLLEHRECALLLIGSYRSTEVAPKDDLMELINRLRSAGVAPSTLELPPLPEQACVEMLSDALGRTPADTASLASAVARKTGAVPLLIQQFVLHMYDLGLIWFDPHTAWTWDDEAIAAADIPDDAAHLFAAKIGRLSSDAAAVVKLASCVGDAFDLDTLGLLTHQPRESLEAGLFTLCDEGLIAPAREGFRFVHDRIREAARAILSPAERSRIHYEAAQLLLEREPNSASSERVFELADHLNLSRDRFTEEDRVRALGINLAAGTRALAAGAAANGASYLAAARELLTASDWDERPDLAMNVLQTSSDTAFHMREFDAALGFADALDQHGIPLLAAARVAAMRIAVHTVQHGSDATLPLVLDQLRRFGIRWSERPSLLRLWLDLLRTDRVLGGALDETQFRPVRGDTAFVAPLLVTGAGGAAFAVRSCRNVLRVSGFAIRTFDRYGILNSPGMSLAVYAGYRHHFGGDFRTTERVAQAALDWCARLPHPVYSHRTEFVVYVYVHAWASRRSVIEPLRRCAEALLEAGDVEYASYAQGWRGVYRALVGDKLTEVLQHFVDLSERSRRIGIRYQVECERALHVLLAPAEDQGEAFESFLSAIDEVITARDSGRMTGAPFWLLALCVLGRWEEALELDRRAGPWIFEVAPCSAQMPDYLFFRGLAAVQFPKSRRRRRLVRQSLRKLERWSRHAPDVEHMARCLEAEICAAKGDAPRALRLYQLAAERATDRKHRHHAALIHERRALLLRRLLRTVEAEAAMRKAIELYSEWGACAKTRALSGMAPPEPRGA